MDSMEAMGMILGLGLVLLYFALIGIAIAEYIMSSYAIFKLAKRRNINNPWLAWIPVANIWMIGKLANDYDLKNGYNRKWQNVLMALIAVFYVVFILFYSLFIFVVIATSMEFGVDFDYDSMMIGSIIIMYVGLILLFLSGMALSACHYICIYKIFESTVPQKAIKYLLLYILVPLAGSICLLKSYNKGYPEEIESEIFNRE